MGQHLRALAGGQALDRQHGRTDSSSAVGDSGQIGVLAGMTQPCLGLPGGMGISEQRPCVVM